MTKGLIAHEAGAVLNKNNKTAVTAAMAILKSVLKAAGFSDEETDDMSADPANTKENPPAKAPTTKTKEHRSSIAVMEAAGFSWADLATLLQNALDDTRPEAQESSYVAPYRVIDIFDDYFIYCVGWSGTEYYRVDYTVSSDGSVTLGLPTYVNRKVTYITPAVSDITASEAGVFNLEEHFTRLAESAVASDGSTLIKLIAPGLGSSGLYTPDVLQRDGASAFPRGTKMYWDHDTSAEEATRPEGTLTRFAAVLDEDARYISEHKAGAGLYARATVFEGYRADLNEIAEHIGTSIRADGRAEMGNYNGARVPIITAIKPSNGVNNRVDFVTAPGAGGRVLSLFESVRKRPTQLDRREDTMTDEQIAAAIAKGIKEGLAPIETQVARLRESATLTEARTFADQTLAGAKYVSLPRPTRERIASAVALNVPLTESGAIDAAKFVAAIETAAQAEAAYLTSTTGRTITIGLGESRASTDTSAGNNANGADPYVTEAEAIFAGWGLTESAAKIAAIGRK